MALLSALKDADKFQGSTPNSYFVLLSAHGPRRFRGLLQGILNMKRERRPRGRGGNKNVEGQAKAENGPRSNPHFSLLISNYLSKVRDISTMKRRHAKGKEEARPTGRKETKA